MLFWDALFLLVRKLLYALRKLRALLPARLRELEFRELLQRSHAVACVL